jgi:1-aminocyclopropane-1-carboxylate deaminase/D-cysteine desulfhydrase-like pyridoxal-dependent ACC family enzyme
MSGLAALLGEQPGRFDDARVEIDDRFVGGGYGVLTDESREAIRLLAGTEAIFLDPTYTAKAMAGLIDGLRRSTFADQATVVFWHTGGQVGLFA